MCACQVPKTEVSKTDIALAFMNLGGIRKLEVVTSVLSATKGEEVWGTTAVSPPNLPFL